MFSAISIKIPRTFSTEIEQKNSKIYMKPQEIHCSSQHYPSSGDLPHPGIKHTSPSSPALQADSWPLNHWGSPIDKYMQLNTTQPWKRTEKNLLFATTWMDLEGIMLWNKSDRIRQILYVTSYTWNLNNTN